MAYPMAYTMAYPMAYPMFCPNPSSRISKDLVKYLTIKICDNKIL